MPSGITIHNRIKVGQQTITESSEITEELNLHFSSVGEKLASEIPSSNVEPESFLEATVVFVRYISFVIHNVRKHAMYIGKFVIKAAWRTFRLDSCVVSVLREYPVPSAVEHNSN